MSTNTEEKRAWAAVPAVAHIEAQLATLEARRRALGDVLSPDMARRKVYDDAARATVEGAQFPADIGKRAAKAYRDALEAESEALGLRAGIDSLKAHLAYLKTTDGAELALTELGKSLAAFLAEVREHIPALGGANSAEEAIHVGNDATEAWKWLTAAVGRLKVLRQAQWNILRPLGDGQRLQSLKERGHLEVAGLKPDDVPSDVLRSMTMGLYDVSYLVYLANSGTAWVPTSFDEVEAEAEDVVDIGVPDDSVIDYSPRVSRTPEPPAPTRHGFERTPDISLK
ncbi:hypothetical protein ACGF3K_33320 [Streptomyces sp. NPDC047980]|uniref:hypothetical protein n=1 Tax=Streptomyces sp. NPDC047980 TaxID=3365494 RepID=UPI003722092D